MKVTPEMAERAKRMRAAGATLRQIAAELGIDRSTVRCHVDPEYAAVRRASINNNRRALYQRKRTGPENRHVDRVRISEADERRALASVPADGRGWLSRFMGDPLPGRSALDRKKNKGASVDNPGNLVVPAIQRDDIEDRHSNEAVR